MLELSKECHPVLQKIWDCWPYTLICCIYYTSMSLSRIEEGRASLDRGIILH